MNYHDYIPSQFLMICSDCLFVFLYPCRPWYTTMIRSRPLEIVLVIDLNAKDVTLTQGLRNAALTVLNSLNRQDKVCP